MKFAVLVYNDPELLGQMPGAEFNSTLRGCIEHADDLRRQGRLSDAQMLDVPSTARSVRVRNGTQTVLDGPFAETKEMLAGFNIIEAESIEEATRMAMEFPWAATGCLEVRPVLDWGAVRQKVGAAPV